MTGAEWMLRSLRREGAGSEHAHVLPCHRGPLHFCPVSHPVAPAPSWAPCPGQLALSLQGELQHLCGQKGWAMSILFPIMPNLQRNTEK